MMHDAKLILCRALLAASVCAAASGCRINRGGATPNGTRNAQNASPREQNTGDSNAIASTVSLGRAGLNDRDPRVVAARKAIYNHLTHNLEFRVDRALTRADRRAAQEAFVGAVQAVEQGLHRTRSHGDYAARARALRTVAFVQSQPAARPVALDTNRHLVLVNVPAGSASWLLADDLWAAVRDVSEGTDSVLITKSPNEVSDQEVDAYVKTLLQVTPELGGSSSSDKEWRKSDYQSERFIAVYDRITDPTLRRKVERWLLRRGRSIVRESSRYQKDPSRAHRVEGHHVEQWFGWFQGHLDRIDERDREGFIDLAFSTAGAAGPDIIQSFNALSLVEPQLPTWMAQWRGSDESNYRDVLPRQAKKVLCPDDRYMHCNGLLYDSILLGPGGSPQRLAKWLTSEDLRWLTRAALYKRVARAGIEPTLQLIEELLRARSPQANEALLTLPRSGMSVGDARRFLGEVSPWWKGYRNNRGALLFAVISVIESTEGVARREDVAKHIGGKVQRKELAAMVELSPAALSVLEALEPSIARGVRLAPLTLPVLRAELDEIHQKRSKRTRHDLLYWVFRSLCRSSGEYAAYRRFLKDRVGLYPSLQRESIYSRVTRQDARDVCPTPPSSGRRRAKTRKSPSTRKPASSRGRKGGTQPAQSSSGSRSGSSDTLLFGD